ncbi:LLM class flavin-dependent oxidoreductase [Novosphingobium rosa]|uniref:LLM class flavin-dependent oxidoreductase n=1 Tax=Novosphingobium rosa TaxID=76978 RepID=UPI000A758F5C|nr:LLM class flavin-dependent oxidoreductase [Novosphingobium rosa]
MPKPIHLWAFLQGIGHYPSGWRHADADPRGVFTMDYYRKVAQTAERGCFDAIVFGDQLQSRGAGGRTPQRLAMPTLDPMSLLSAMASVTQHVGLVATVSTTYNTPEMLAERFGTLDRISGGRAGWNIVTTAHPDTAPNFGETELPEKSLRYRLAAQTVAETSALWDGLNAQHGPSPQLRPVYVQAGQSNDGRDFAARTAEAIFCPAATIEDGIAFRSDLRRRIAEAGRDPDGVKIMPGLSFMLADTPEEAIARDEALLALADEALCIEYLSESLGFDITSYPADGPIPAEAIVAGTILPAADIARALEKPVAQGVTLGAFASRFVRTPRGHNIFRGTPEQMAEMMIAWVEAGACDGFTLQPAFMASELEMFVERVVPLLQARGALRKAYPGTTLRETMGLTRLPSEMAA